MSDEISQVVELEYKGVYYVIKGSTKFISYVAKGLKALGEFAYKKFDARSGSCTWDRLQRLSEGTPPILEFPKEMLEEKLNFPGEKKPMTIFEHYCKENNLHYCVLPDFNEFDDYVPVGVLAQDIAIHQEHIKAVMNKRIATEEDTDKNYDNLLMDLRDQLANETDIKAKDELETKIENIEVAKAQNKELLDESKEKASNGNVLDFIDYLKQGENTNFKEDPDAAIKDVEDQGIIKEFKPEECMYPIRDKELVPESKEVYYSQSVGDDVFSVRREFKEDSRGIVFSNYRVVDSKNPNNTLEFSDKGMTSKRFKEKLPSFLKEAGMIADKPTKAMRNISSYAKYLENINFKDASNEQGFSSDEAKKFIEKQVENDIRRDNYDKSRVRTFIVPLDKVMIDDNRRLVFESDEGLVEGVNIVCTDNEAQILVNKDKDYSISKRDGEKINLNGDVLIEKLTKNKSESDYHAKAQKR